MVKGVIYNQETPIWDLKMGGGFGGEGAEEPGGGGGGGGRPGGLHYTALWGLWGLWGENVNRWYKPGVNTSRVRAKVVTDVHSKGHWGIY